MTFGLISRKVIAKEDGKINLILPPESFGIFVVTDERKKMRKSNVRVEITNLSDGAKMKGDFVVKSVTYCAKKVRVYFDRETKEYLEIILIDDNKGPSGEYLYPTDITFKRWVDIDYVKVKEDHIFLLT